MVALVGGCYQGAWVQSALGLIHHEPWNWAEMALRGGTWAIGMAGFLAIQAAGWFFPPDEREGRAMVERALAAGELPPIARVDAWRPVLAREIRELRLGRRIVVPFMLLVAAFVAASAVANDNDPGVWALAIALGGFAGVPLRWFSVRQQRAEALLARVPAG
jgi:hypothetical protein